MIPEKHIDNAELACKDIGITLGEITFRNEKNGITGLYCYREHLYPWLAINKQKFVFSISFETGRFDFRFKEKHLEHTLKAFRRPNSKSYILKPYVSPVFSEIRSFGIGKNA